MKTIICLLVSQKFNISAFNISFLLLLRVCEAKVYVRNVNYSNYTNKTKHEHLLAEYYQGRNPNFFLQSSMW